MDGPRNDPGCRVVDILFLGTGAPRPSLHVAASATDTGGRAARAGPSSRMPLINCQCAVCLRAAATNDRNRRGNTALLVRADQADGTMRTILIDCGKSFYEQAHRWLAPRSIRHIDAVLLTHEHADAILGLDDLRDMRAEGPIPIYVTPSAMPHVRNVFPYLVDPSKATGSGIVSNLEFRVFDPAQCLRVHGIAFVPLAVEHGSCRTWGFRFDNVSYIADASAIPETTLGRMHGSRMLILDCIGRSLGFGSHLCLNDAIAYAMRLKPWPSRTFFIGMAHSLEHTATCAELAALTATASYPWMRLAHDGLQLPLPAAFEASYDIDAV